MKKYDYQGDKLVESNYYPTQEEVDKNVTELVKHAWNLGINFSNVTVARNPNFPQTHKVKTDFNDVWVYQ